MQNNSVRPQSLIVLIAHFDVCNQVAKSHEILMFVSKKTPNNAVTPQSLNILIVMHGQQYVIDNEYSQALWRHSIVGRLFGDKQTS